MESMNVRCLAIGLPPRDDAPSGVVAEGKTSVRSPIVGFFSSCAITVAMIAGCMANWPIQFTAATAKAKRNHEAAPENQRRPTGTFAHRIVASNQPEA